MSIKTSGHKKALSKQLNPLCGICLAPITDIEAATIDHIVPLSLGGSNYRDNVQLAHSKCNRRKGNNLSYTARKPNCPACHRTFKNIKAHIAAKHPEIKS